MKTYISLILCLVILVGSAGAVPTTLAVTGITERQVTFNANNGAGTAHFEWGSATSMMWSTPNQTVSGVFSDYQLGPPMLNGRTYYVRACDDTGCGGSVSFVTPAVIPINQTRYGRYTLNIMRSGFNITETLQIIIKPYTQQFGGTTVGAPWIWGLFFLFVFTWYWIKQGDIMTTMILAMLFGALIWGTGSSLGIPPEVQDIGVGMFAAALAGVFMSWFSK
jgi:hypothetical protein